MGKAILCAGRQSEKAFRFPNTGASIYSIEELCYYICHFVEHLGEELLDPALADYIREELGLADCAARLSRLYENHAGVKDAILVILNSVSYYNRGEIDKIISEYDVINSLTPLQRRKRYADKCLENGRNREAMHLYRDILYSSESGEIDSVEYGNILHNVAIVHARAGAFATAADEFREAYARNNDMRSLKQYLYALKFGHREDEFDREISMFTDNRQLLDQIENELYYITDTEENTYDYHEFKKLRELREKGRVADYYRAADEFVTQLKNKYRMENG